MVSEKNIVLSDRDHFLKFIDQNTIGLIWISDFPLQERESPFFWLDYLLNGALENHIHQFKKDNKSFFIGKHFDHLFHLGQISNNHNNLKNEINNFIELFNEKESINKVIILTTQKFSRDQFKIKSKKNLIVNHLFYSNEIIDE